MGDQHVMLSIQTAVPKNISSSPWNDQFDAQKYTNARLPFHDDFPNDFHIVSWRETRRLSNIL